jgi:hypothetical protein
MTFQALHLGLAVRQFRAFDRDALAAEFGVPPHWEVTTMSAIGRVPAATPYVVPGWDRAQSPGDRRPVSHLRWPDAAGDRLD